MSDDTVVPNQQPTSDPGAVRLAIIGEAPAVEEVSWQTCTSGHGFALQHWSNRQLVTRDRCVLCGTRTFEATPRPFSGESGRLLDSILADSGLPRSHVMVANCSRRPLHEGEKTLAHCGPGLARLAVDLEQFRPHAVLVLGNLALSAFCGEGKSVTNWRGSITQGRLERTMYKVVVALHPAAVLREPSQLALLRMDVKRAVDEAATAFYEPPVREYWYPQSGVALCKRPVRELVPPDEDNVPF